VLLLLLLAQAVTLPSATDCPGDFFLHKDKDFNPAGYFREDLARGTVEIQAGTFLGYTCGIGRELSEWQAVSLSRIPHLAFVDARGPVTDRGLAALAGMKSLRWLVLRDLGDVTARGLAALAETSTLVHLDLSADALDDDTLASYAKLARLEQLACSGELLTGKGLAAFANHASLRVVRLSSPAVDDHVFAHLQRLPALDTLDLYGSKKLSDLAALRDCKRLRSIRLTRCRAISAAGLRPLGDVRTLEDVVLYECDGVSDDTADALAKLPSLARLTLGNCPRLTDAALGPIAKLKLRALNLRENALTDAGLKALHGMATLEELDLWLCPKLTKEAKAELAKSLPALKKFHGRGE
jgi:hypothetical protein